MNAGELRWADLGGPVAHATWGGDGPPLVLVHGLAGARINWMAVGEDLARSRRVLAPDLIGFGDTPRAGRRAVIEGHRSLLDRYLREVAGEPALLCGHSMGGLLAILQAAAEPDTVRGLVILGAALPGELGQVVAGFERHLLPLLALAPALGGRLARRQVVSTGVERVVRDSMRHVTTDATVLSEELVAAHVELERRRSQGSEGYRAYLESWRSLRDLLRERRQVDAAIAAVRCPVVMVHGALDRLVPVANARRAAGLRPDWTYLERPAGGHSLEFEDPGGLVDLLRGWPDR